MPKIDHPQVYIYSYQLSRESQSQVDSIWNWANNIWQHFSQDKSLIFSSPENLSYPLTKATKFRHSNRIDGSFKFCRLDDADGILARIGSPETDENKDLEIAALTNFNVDNLLVADNQENWLGQTILITYKFETYQKPGKDYFRQVADECLRHLLPSESVRPPFYHADELFDAPIFEYSSPRSQLQVFVYPIDDDIEGKLGKILQPLFELFYHRHKITKAFIDSRRNYELLKKQYLEIEQTIEKLETKITKLNEISGQPVNTDDFLKELKIKLKELLRESLNYERALEYLEDYHNTIVIHVLNYQEKLSQISKKWEIVTESLTTFKFFSDRSCRYFEQQIKGDLGYFKHGTDLIKIAVDLVRGIVEIEQAENDRASELRDKNRDRNLQITIAVVGVGIGVAGVVSSSYTLAVDKPWAPPSFQHPLPLHPFFSAIIVSCLGGGILGGVAWLIARKVLKPSSAQTSLPPSENQPPSIDV
jgi:hypothetical protein